MKQRRYRGLMETINYNICGDGYDASERAEIIFNKCQDRIDSAYNDGYQQGRADAINEFVEIFEASWATDTSETWTHFVHKIAERLKKNGEGK